MSQSIQVVSSESDVIQSLWTEIDKSAKLAITENGVFRIGVSGGSLIKFLAEGIEQSKSELEKWQIFFCDERYVDESDVESTFGQYKKLLMPKSKLKESQFVAINRSLDLVDCAKDYADKILKRFGLESESSEVPCFDSLLLGMGPDGHTCSLFPGHPLLKESAVLIAPISDSPKPPPERVTMTYSLVNNAKQCIFAISGKGKAPMVKVRRVNKIKMIRKKMIF